MSPKLHRSYKGEQISCYKKSFREVDVSCMICFGFCRLTIEDIPMTAIADEEDPVESFDGDEFWENIDPEKLNRITKASIKSKKFKDEWRRKQEASASTSHSTPESPARGE